jgi:hypothetical protein
VKNGQRICGLCDAVLPLPEAQAPAQEETKAPKKRKKGDK